MASLFEMQAYARQAANRTRAPAAVYFSAKVGTYGWIPLIDWNSSAQIRRLVNLVKVVYPDGN